MKRLSSNKKPSQKLFTLSVLAVVCSSSMLVSTGCKSDRANTQRVIETPDDTQEQKQTQQLNMSVSFNNAALTMHDVTNDKLLLTKVLLQPTPEAQSETDNSSSENTESDTQTKGIEIAINKDDIAKDAFVITTIHSSNNDATYYDTSLNKEVVIPADKPLIALSKTGPSGQISNVIPTPFTTLAYYRALAKVGWFYTHDNLPTTSELTQLLKQETSFSRHYSLALVELRETFLFDNSIFSNFAKTTDLIQELNKITKDIKISASTRSWLTAVATLRNYNKTFNSNAPYFTFAHDLAKDFFDGDIDGATLKGLGDKSLNSSQQLLSQALVQHVPNTVSDNFTKVSGSHAIFERQKEVIVAYNKSVFEEIQTLKNELVTGANSDKQNILDTKLTGLLSILKQHDIYRGSNISYNAYAGIANKTKAFGLPNTLSVEKSINLDDSVPIALIAQNLIGTYSKDGCELTINSNGVVTVNSQGSGFTAFIDREPGDSIYRVKDETQKYRVNVAVDDKASKQKRVIQMQVHDQQIISAATSLVDEVSTEQLTNPDTICAFK